MGKLVAVTETTVPAPSSGSVALYPDATTLRMASVNTNGAITKYGYAVTNASVGTVSAAYATDTYLAGSSVTIPTAGDWSAKQTYRCVFDLTKTAAGTATLILTVRMGTAGTTADASIMTFTFAAGTAAVDDGRFVVELTFQTVGSGTSAVIGGMATCMHALAATGLIQTGASGTGIIRATSAGFNSTTQTVLGLSVNGGTSFSGTNTMVQARTEK